ncbi:MAG TPA: hypothetical protein VKE49_00150 [Myxococcaceae bacterium]|nr:hypothetical protein [Myxococcaceae bacterium]
MADLDAMGALRSPAIGRVADRSPSSKLATRPPPFPGSGTDGRALEGALGIGSGPVPGKGTDWLAAADPTAAVRRDAPLPGSGIACEI